MAQSKAAIRQSVRLIVTSFCAVLLIACSDGSDNPGTGSVVPLEDMLPATSRGFLAVSLTDENRAPELRRTLDGASDPWRQHPLDILAGLDDGLDIVDHADELILVQPTLSGDEFALLSTVAAEQGNELFQAASLQDAGDYRNEDLWLVEDSGFTLARPDERTWLVGPRISVERILDVRSGSAPGIEQAAIAPYLVENEGQVPVSFVYGLPELYAEVATPGDGDASLNRAVAVRGALDSVGGVLDGEVQFVAANAEVYTNRLLGLLSEGSPEVFGVSGEVLSVDVTGMTTGDLLPLFKSMFPGMNAVDYAEAVTHGGNPPWMNFDVGENPNSIFINFQFKNDAQRAAFATDHLPEGFTLAPLRIIRHEPPRYYLVLNIYQASGGLVEGARAEWSVFVNDPETGEARFLVVQAAAESFSVDSVNLLTLPEPVSHIQESDAIVSYVGVVDEDTGEESPYFSSRIEWPLLPATYFAREFAVANDFIFWGNGVADRGLYNGTVHARQATLVSDSRITLQDDSRWAPYLHHEPVHTLVYQNSLEIVISPWWNLDEDYLDVTEDYRQELIDFKNGFYPGAVLLAAEAAMRGQRPALTTSMAGLGAGDSGDVNTTYFHFTIRDADALLDSLGVAGRYNPVAIPYYGAWVERDNLPFYEDEEAQMYLTLALYRLEDDPCGVRADWLMPVQNDEGRVSTLRLETLSSDACIDPVSFLGLPAVVWQRYDSGQGSTVQSWTMGVFSAFSRLEVAASYLAPPNGGSDEVMPSQIWIAAGDEVCSLNDVCNANFYDGMTLGQTLLRMRGEDIQIRELMTPFDDFIDPVPAEVTIRQKPAILGSNPWVNVPVFGTQ